MKLSSSGMNITQQVADTLGQAIVKGMYGDHNPVPSEAVLCKQLAVSRSAAREAVKSLAAKGLITSRARQGIRVLPESEWNLFDVDVLRWIRDANPSLQLLREFTQLRVAIEPQAAILATQNQNGPLIQMIADALDRMRRAEKGLEDPLESDIAFHRAILDASENRFFMQLGWIIDTTLRVSIRFTNRRTGVIAGVYADHKKIYDGIVNKQPEVAKNTATTLLLETLATIDEALAEENKVA